MVRRRRSPILMAYFPEKSEALQRRDELLKPSKHLVVKKKEHIGGYLLARIVEESAKLTEKKRHNINYNYMHSAQQIVSRNDGMPIRIRWEFFFLNDE